MLIPHLLPLAVLACSTAAKPVARASLHNRQFTNSSIPGIMQTSIGTAPSPTVEEEPACTDTYVPSEDENCSDIAIRQRIRLSQFEANYPSTSHQCRDILHGYGICCDRSRNDETGNESTTGVTTGTTLATTNTLPSTTEMATSIYRTIPSGSHTSMTIVSNSTNVVVAHHAGTRERIVTRLETTTLSYTLGKAGATVRTVVVTRTFTDVTTCTSTVMDDTTSSPTSLLQKSVLVTFPTQDATCSGTTPPPAAVTNGVVGGCTQWYTAIPGDFCYKVAQQFGIPVTVFMDWNPSINAPWCTNLYAGSAYCVATCGTSGGGSVSSGDSAPDKSSPTLPSVSSPTLPDIPSPTLPYIPSPTLPNIPSPTLPSVSSPTLPDLPSPTLPSIPSPTLPDLPSPTLPSIPSPTLPNIPSPTLPAGITTLPAIPTPPIGTTTVSSSSLPTSIPSPETTTDTQPAAPSATSRTDVYRSYLGNGSLTAGWPSIKQWVPFDYMFEQNRPNMLISCSQWGVPDDSDEEIASLKSAITNTSSSSGMDARFILAITIQESQGCVRVITTAYSHPNPGLMQTHNGTGTCNTNLAPLGIPGVANNGIVQTPCPHSEIMTMVKEGTEGTAYGDGLVQLFEQQGDPGAQGYYRTARLYNGGSIDPSGLLERGCCTASYASDIANRLTGWVNAPRSFSG